MQPQAFSYSTHFTAESHIQYASPAVRDWLAGAFCAFLQDVWCFFILCVCVHRLFFVVYSVRLAHYCYAIGSAHIFIYDLVLQHLVFINDARTMCKIVSLCFCLSITTTSCTALSSCWLRRLAIIITLLLVFLTRMITSRSSVRRIFFKNCIYHTCALLI